MAIMRTAALIFSFNRPEYLAPVLTSLKKQTDLNLDYVLVQDGAINMISRRKYANEHVIRQCISLFKEAELPGAQTVISSHNMGMAHQKLIGYSYAFKDHDYDACIVFEDDLVVAPHYVRLMRILLQQYGSDREVATVQASDNDDKSINYSNLTQKELTKVVKSSRHFWGYGTWKDRWLQHAPYYNKYYSLVRNRDYRQRPHDMIRKLTGIKQTSHDAALDWCIKECNQYKINTLVPRATYIGRKGLHCRPDLFIKSGYERMLDNKIDFEEDKDIDKFIR